MLVVVPTLDLLTQTARAYGQALAGGDEDGEAGRGGGGKRGGQRPAAECGCTPPRRLFPTRKQLDEGPILCGLCGEAFEAVDAP